MIVLVCGLPGSGKSTLCEQLVSLLPEGEVTHLNADRIRARVNDWDFSMAGRERQARRMRACAENALTDFVLCDFVAPTAALRGAVRADFTVWCNTISSSRYPDTDAVFQPVEDADIILNAWPTPVQCATIAATIQQRRSKS